jgi:succinoglycan biosynthesis protein ExoM
MVNRLLAPDNAVLKTWQSYLMKHSSLVHEKRTAQVGIDVCVCTYRRSELQKTLESLASINLPPNCRARIIISDNDVTPSAREVAFAFAVASPFPVDYIHSPAGNISIARNACLDATTGDVAAFIDDDETASPDWLLHLLETARSSGADVVLGPVKAAYGDCAPRWMVKGDFHSTMPVWVRGQIRTGYTCNVLLNLMSPHIAGRRFNIGLGRSGGEDTFFFAQVHEAGGVIAFAPDAWVYESVPPARARLDWLVKRRFRVGQTHGRLLSQGCSYPMRLPHIVLAGSKIVFSFGTAVAYILSPKGRNRALLRGIMHIGVVSGLLGMREIEQYGAPTRSLSSKVRCEP